MLPAIPAILWWILGGVALGGAAAGLLFMDDEDTQAAANWLHDNGLEGFAGAFCFFVRVRGWIRKQLGIRVHNYDNQVQIVQSRTVSIDDLPEDVREQLERKDRVVVDVTKELSMSLSR